MIIRTLSRFRNTRLLSGAAVLAIEEAEKQGNLPEVLIDLSRFSMRRLRSMSHIEKEQDTPIIEIPPVSKQIQPSINISDAIESYGDTEISTEYQEDSPPIRRFDETPISRIAATIITGAISDNFTEIRLESTHKGLMVLYIRSNEEPGQRMPLPKYIIQPITNKIKLLAGIPYWSETNKPGEFMIRYSEKLYQLKVFPNPEDPSEHMRIIINKTSDGE